MRRRSSFSASHHGGLGIVRSGPSGSAGLSVDSDWWAPAQFRIAGPICSEHRERRHGRSIGRLLEIGQKVGPADSDPPRMTRPFG